MTADRADALWTLATVTAAIAALAGIVFYSNVFAAVICVLAIVASLVAIAFGAAWLAATFWALVTGHYPRWWE